MDNAAQVVITEGGSVPGAVVPPTVPTSQGSCKPGAVSPGSPGCLLIRGAREMHPQTSCTEWLFQQVEGKEEGLVKD